MKSKEITKIYLVTNCYEDKNKVYIGKTKGSRELAHKCTYGSQIEYSYIDEINSLKYKDWKPLESFWISYFKFLGFEVLNKNEGGGGPEFHSKETRLKMKKPKSKKHRLNISKSKKGILKTDEVRKRLGIKKGFKYSEESKLKMRKPKPKGFGKNLSINRIGKNRPEIEKPILQYDLEGNLIQKWTSITKASKKLNIFQSGISACLIGQQKTAYGYIWKYK